MIQVLKTLWSKHKAFSWQKKLLMFLPVIIMSIVLIGLFWVKFKDDDEKFEESTDYHKQYVDKQIKRRVDADKELEKQDNKLKAKQDKLQQEIDDNETKAENLNSRINTAASNADADELERIRTELNAASRGRTSS